MDAVTQHNMKSFSFSVISHSQTFIALWHLKNGYVLCLFKGYSNVCYGESLIQAAVCNKLSRLYWVVQELQKCISYSSPCCKFQVLHLVEHCLPHRYLTWQTE